MFMMLSMEMLLIINAAFFPWTELQAAFGGNVPLAKSYLQNVEPYLSDTSCFSKVQVLQMGRDAAQWVEW